MSPAAAALRGELRRFFEALRELEKTDQHLQSWRPVAVAPLGVLRGPRGGR